MRSAFAVERGRAGQQIDLLLAQELDHALRRHFVLEEQRGGVAQRQRQTEIEAVRLEQRHRGEDAIFRRHVERLGGIDRGLLEVLVGAHHPFGVPHRVVGEEHGGGLGRRLLHHLVDGAGEQRALQAAAALQLLAPHLLFVRLRRRRRRSVDAAARPRDQRAQRRVLQDQRKIARAGRRIERHHGGADLR
jgi:hypothetical protein